MTNNAQFDRNTLAAVKPGLDSTLAVITEQMETYLGAPGSNVVALEKVRTELRSLLGVLKMVGLDGVAVFCEELATTLSDLAANPQQVSPMHRDALRHALFGITHYLDALASGVDNAALRLFPQYQELQQLRGLEMSFEMDLFFPNLDVQLPSQVLKMAPPADALTRLKAMRSQYQQGLLRWLKQEDVVATLQQMQQAIQGAIACVPQNEGRAFWWVAYGLLECMKLDGLPAGMDVRKLLGRIDQQLRTVAEGNASDVREVMNEMLYIIGRGHAESDVLKGIKQGYSLDNYLPAQSALPPGEIDQLLAVMRDQLHVAEESWELCIQGDNVACEKFIKYAEQMALQSDKLDRDVLQYLTKQILGLSEYATTPEYAQPIAMDMAMALLLLNSGIENYNRLGSGFQEQARILIERMQAAVKQQPEDEGRLGELVGLNEQRNDVLGPLANEMLVNLQSVEQALNAFFNDAAKRDGLPELLRLLGQIHGGFRISSLSHAEKLLAAVQDRVRRFVKGTAIPRSAERYALADALSALENYMQHLMHGQTADVWRLEEALSEMIKLDQAPEPAAAPSQATKAAVTPAVSPVAKAVAVPPEVASLTIAAAVPATDQLETVAPIEIAPVAKPSVSAPLEFAPAEQSQTSVALEFTPVEKPQTAAPPETTPVAAFQAIAPIEVLKFEPPPVAKQALTEEEQELLNIFLEEAKEVLGTIRANHKTCVAQPANHEALVTVRRGFHTLKGSGRMVGLNDLGEVAWSVERALNKRLQESKPASPGLLHFIDTAVQYFAGWVEELGKQGVAQIEAPDLIEAAQKIESGLDLEIPVNVAIPAIISEPQVELAVEPTTEAVAEKDEAEPAPFPAPEPASESAVDILAALATEPAAEPVAEFTAEPAVEIVAETQAEPAVEFTTELAVEPAVESTAEPEIEAAVEFELEPEPEAEPVAEFKAEFAAEPATEIPAEPPLSIEGTASEEGVLSPGLFDIASAEAKQNADILRQQFDVLRTSASPKVQYDFVRAAHTLAGVTRTMGFDEVAELAGALEGWLEARVEQSYAISGNQLLMLEQTITALEEMVLSVCNLQMPEMRSDLVEQLLAGKETTGEQVAERDHIPEAVPLHATEPLSSVEQAGDIMFDQMFAELGKIKEVAEEAVRPEEAEKPQVADDLYAQIIADMGNAGKAAAEQIITPEKDEQETTLPLMVDAGRFNEAEEAVSEPEVKQPAPAQEIKAPDEAKIPPLEEVLRPVERVIAKPKEEPGDVEKPQVFDEIDDQLLPVFLEEADDLGPKISEGLRAWHESPQDQQLEHSLKRTLHTMKGSSRMVGAMRIGEIAHEMENQVAAAYKREEPGYWDTLEADFDRINALLEELRGGKPAVEVKAPTSPVAPTAKAGTTLTPARRSTDQPVGIERRADRRGEAPLGNMLRVRSDVVDRLVNEAAEISVVRSRMEIEMRIFKEGLLELTASVARLRQQLREVEIQAESQMQARVSSAKDNAEEFDPLEFDRFTRLQELTRFMNESVHDVQTIQQSMLKHLDETAAAMLTQGRLSRELQQGLMNVRMISFNSITDRLYRIVRQTGKELNKRANLELQGTNVELDRSVLEKMVAPFEHLLRNSIVHGLENEQIRVQSGKHPIGEIRLSVRQESNEVVFEFSDDGAGLNYPKLREKGIDSGMLRPDEEVSEEQLAQLIFMPGLSTATEITEIAGRGVGMDVVRSEIMGLGGRIDVSSKRGQGAQFIIHLPLTLAVTQILMVRAGEAVYAIPSAMVEQVRQVKSSEMEDLCRERQIEWHDNIYPLHYLSHLVGNTDEAQQIQPRNPVLLLRSDEQHIALHVDELLGNQEVMVKNIGPQLARLAGIAGATVLGDGRVVMILNPAQLAHRTSITARHVRETGVASHQPDQAPAQASVPTVATPLATQPLIMVVDDSLTVRKITSRMLLRAGYQVVTATDGVDALEKLEECMPDVMLLDIEMPRMDGFALAKQLRRDPRTHNLPIIMITSRTADKHREYAMQLGVNTYLGKPYQEDDLLQNIADFVAVHKLDA